MKTIFIMKICDYDIYYSGEYYDIYLDGALLDSKNTLEECIEFTFYES